jgi:TonB family protein
MGRSALLIAFWVGLPTATLSAGSEANTVVPVFVHSRIGSTHCELVRRGSLVIAKQYAWVEIEGRKSETYSPEMGTGDYLSAASISGRVREGAHKSGFELKSESKIPADLPRVRALGGDTPCLDLQGAITEVEQATALRRAELQSRLYKTGVDDISMPLALKQEVNQSDQSTAPNDSGDGTNTVVKKKFKGTVTLAVLVDSEGVVKQSKVVRSANPELDKKAQEVVARWKFAPARKKGLPVPSVVPIEITFNLQ